MFTRVLTQLGIDGTLGVQLVIFIVLYFALRALYFRPFLNLLEFREKATADRQRKVEEFNRLVEEKEQSYHEQIAKAKQQAGEKSHVLLAKAKSEAATTIGQTRTKNKKKIEEARAGITKEAMQVKEDLKKETGKVSEFFLNKLVGSHMSRQRGA